MNKSKRFLCIFFCLIFVCLSFAPINTVVAKKDSYLDWKQSDSRWGSETIGNSNVKTIGCTVTSIAILLKHSGIMDDKFTPLTFVKKLKSKDIGGFSGNLFMWNSVDKVTSGNFKFKEKKTGVSLDTVSEYYKKGYFITLCVNYISPKKPNGGTHWVAIINADSSKEKKIKIADPGHSNVTTIKQLYAQYTKVNSIDFSYYECSKVKANEVSKSGSSGSNSSGDNKKDKVQLTDKDNTVKLGNGKLGLVDPVSGKLYQLNEGEVEMPVLDDLSNDQLKGVSDWKNNIDYIHGGGIIKYIRILVSFVGILFIVWMVLIYLSYWYDRINNFVDIELLPIVTAGQLKVSPEEDNCTFNPKGIIRGTQQTVNHRTVLKICLIGIAFSVFIISGKVYEVIAFLVYYLMNFINRNF